MKRLFNTTLFIIITGIFTALNTYACRYTVREIGFSDIGSLPYLIYVFTNSDMPEDDISRIRKLSFALLYETNVKLEIVNVDKEMDSSILHYLDKHNIQSFPSALFVSPQGESLICSLNYPGRSFDESIWLLLENLVASPVRNSIIDQLLQSYCVVLVVEGTDTSKNKNALRVANEAVMEISGTLYQMPKVVNAPPGILVIPREKIRSERILLMSLGIRDEESTELSVAIIYGRGRIIGPVLSGQQITPRSIFNLLAVVGADCECGLEQSWILGKMIPLRWESSVQSALARFLGFDVESPPIKAEMSQILSLKPPPDILLDPLGGSLLGYSEGKLMIDTNLKNVPKISASEIRKSFYPAETSKKNLVLISMLMCFGGILIFVIIIFLFIQFKRRKTLR